MSVHTSFPSTFRQAHERAVEDVNRWRGHCMELHARYEQAVKDSLLPRLDGEQMPQTFERCVKSLATLLKKAASPASNKIVDALTELQKLREWRDRLAHATSMVHLDTNREWIWHWSLPGSNGDQFEGSLRQAEALKTEKELSAQVKKLRSLLGQVGKQDAVAD